MTIITLTTSLSPFRSQAEGEVTEVDFGSQESVEAVRYGENTHEEHTKEEPRDEESIGRENAEVSVPIEEEDNDTDVTGFVTGSTSSRTEATARSDAAAEDNLGPDTSTTSPQTASASQQATTTKGERGTKAGTLQSTSTPATTVVATGPAAAATQAESDVNQLNVQVPRSHASSTEDGEIAIVSAQNAVLEQSGTTTAATGDNVATSSMEALITTGDAHASHRFLNVVNTTVINSQGFFLLLNELFAEGEIDTRRVDFDAHFGTATRTSAVATTACSLNGCDDPKITYRVMSSSTATVSNSYIVRANTGGNMANGDVAAIRTGNAYAGVNGVNVANSNFIDSRYLLISLNNVGDYVGDLVLPGAQFFSRFLAPKVGVDKVATEVINDATVVNTITGIAGTGGNSASTTGEAVVHTGDSCALVGVENTVNQTYVGAGMVNILVRVAGDWSGEIFGLPRGLTWERTADGIRIYNEAVSATTTTTSGSSVPIANGTTTLRNSAYIHNDITVTALTGDNRVVGGDGRIKTGEACVAANIQNIANTNIIGSNWMSAFFHILGDFEGDIAFGRPDLWLGATASQVGEYVRAGDTLRYSYTLFNNGDAPAHNIVLRQDTDRHLQNVQTDQLSPLGTSTQAWQLGALGPGQSVEIPFTAQVASNLPYGTTPIVLAATTHSAEPDANVDDNTERLTLTAHRVGGGTSRGRTGSSASAVSNQAPALSVLKRVSTSTAVIIDDAEGSAATSTPVSYTITVKNDGGEAYGAVLYDKLTNAAGEVVHAQSWQLGTVAAGETIEVRYRIDFPVSLGGGLFSNRAWLVGYESSAAARSGRAEERFETNVSTAAFTRAALALSGVVVEPTIDNVTFKGAAVVTWQSNTPADSRVVYGVARAGNTFMPDARSLGYDIEKTIPRATTTHTVVLTNLVPGATYTFRAASVAGGVMAVSHEGSFTVPGVVPAPQDATPRATSAEPFLFAVSRDTREDAGGTMRPRDGDGAILGVATSAVSFAPTQSYEMPPPYTPTPAGSDKCTAVPMLKGLFHLAPSILFSSVLGLYIETYEAVLTQLAPAACAHRVIAAYLVR